jgi:hypothetical protein
VIIADYVAIGVLIVLEHSDLIPSQSGRQRVLAVVFGPSILKHRRCGSGFNSMARPRVNPFRFLQREKIVLRQDRPMLFQHPVIFPENGGCSFGFVGAILGTQCAFANLLPEFAQQSSDPAENQSMRLPDFDCAFA